MSYERICKKCGKKFIANGPATQYCQNCMDISGQRIGLWEVLRRAADRGHCDYWECRCNGCGQIKEVNGYNL